MNDIEFVKRAQILMSKAVQSKSNIECSIKRFDDGVLSFDITHFDKRYGPDGNPNNNRSIVAYNSLSNVNMILNEIQCFIDKLIAGEDALIKK